jgi:hypothetical protein
MKQIKPSIINNLDENFVSREEYFIIIQELRRRRTRARNKYRSTD